MNSLTKIALGLTLIVGAAGLTVGCSDENVSTTERTRVEGDGDSVKKTQETRVNEDTGTVTKETTVKKTDAD